MTERSGHRFEQSTDTHQAHLLDEVRDFIEHPPHIEVLQTAFGYGGDELNDADREALQLTNQLKLRLGHLRTLYQDVQAAGETADLVQLQREYERVRTLHQSVLARLPDLVATKEAVSELAPAAELTPEESWGKRIPVHGSDREGWRVGKTAAAGLFAPDEHSPKMLAMREDQWRGSLPESRHHERAAARATFERANTLRAENRSVPPSTQGESTEVNPDDVLLDDMISPEQPKKIVAGLEEVGEDTDFNWEVHPSDKSAEIRVGDEFWFTTPTGERKLVRVKVEDPEHPYVVWSDEERRMGGRVSAADLERVVKEAADEESDTEEPPVATDEAAEAADTTTVTEPTGAEVNAEASATASAMEGATDDLPERDPASAELYKEWKEVRENAESVSRQYNDALQKFYDGYYEQQGGRRVFNPKKLGIATKEFFGIKPTLTPELQTLKVREEYLAAEYARLGGELVEQRRTQSKEAGTDTAEPKDEQVIARYERMLDRKIALRPIEERINMQKQAMEAMPQNKTFTAMTSFLKKYKYGLLAGKVVVYGGVGALTGGLAAGGLAAGRVAAGFAGGAAGGYSAHRLFEGRVNRAEVVKQSVLDKKMDGLSALELRRRRAELVEAYTIKDKRLRDQRVAAVAASVIGGGVAATYGYDFAADKISDARQEYLFRHAANQPVVLENVGAPNEPAGFADRLPVGAGLSPDAAAEQPEALGEVSMDRSPDSVEVKRLADEPTRPQVASEVSTPEIPAVRPESPNFSTDSAGTAVEYPNRSVDLPPLPGMEAPTTFEQPAPLPSPHGATEPSLAEDLAAQEQAFADYRATQNVEVTSTEPRLVDVTKAREAFSADPTQYKTAGEVAAVEAEVPVETVESAEKTKLEYTSAERLSNQEHLFQLGEQYGQSTVSEQVYAAWKDGAFDHLEWVPGPDELSRQEFLDRMNAFVDQRGSDAMTAVEIQAMGIGSGDFHAMQSGAEYDAVPLLDKMFPPSGSEVIDVPRPAAQTDAVPSVEQPATPVVDESKPIEPSEAEVAMSAESEVNEEVASTEADDVTPEASTQTPEEMRAVLEAAVSKSTDHLVDTYKGALNREVSSAIFSEAAQLVIEAQQSGAIDTTSVEVVSEALNTEIDVLANQRLYTGLLDGPALEVFSSGTPRQLTDMLEGPAREAQAALSTLFVQASGDGLLSPSLRTVSSTADIVESLTRGGLLKFDAAQHAFVDGQGHAVVNLNTESV